MKDFYIKVVLPDTGDIVLADSTIYTAENGLEALKQFAEKRNNDYDTDYAVVISEDPFLLKIRGYVETDPLLFEMMEETFEFIAEEIDENRSKETSGQEI